jgi:hypothetical protein
MTQSILNSELIGQWVSEKKDIDKVKEELVLLNYDEGTINLYVAEFRKRKIKERQTAGFILLSVGAVLGFFSCLFTIINPIPSLYFIVLYGLTSLAVVIIVLGLYFLFE